MVSMATKLQKTTINLAERTMASPRPRIMALGMRRRHQVAENRREIEGAPVDCPGSGTPESSFCRPVAPKSKCSNRISHHIYNVTILGVYLYI